MFPVGVFQVKSPMNDFNSWTEIKLIQVQNYVDSAEQQLRAKHQYLDRFF